jgi:hypothetical protein
MTGHRISWFGVVPGSGERVRRNRHMAGGDWGWDVVCSCGWETRTGGATQQSVRDAIYWHRFDVERETVR